MVVQLERRVPGHWPARFGAEERLQGPPYRYMVTQHTGVCPLIVGRIFRTLRGHLVLVLGGHARQDLTRIAVQHTDTVAPLVVEFPHKEAMENVKPFCAPL